MLIATNRKMSGTSSFELSQEKKLACTLTTLLRLGSLFIVFTLVILRIVFVAISFLLILVVMLRVCFDDYEG